jgi:hypothetical protein
MTNSIISNPIVKALFITCLLVPDIYGCSAVTEDHVSIPVEVKARRVIYQTMALPSRRLISPIILLASNSPPKTF